MFELNGRELLAIYLMMKDQENEFDHPRQVLFNRLETFLYGYLSIEEMENIEELYESGDDVIAERGYS